MCSVSFVRNSVNELFVQGTCNVFMVNVCFFLNIMELSCCVGRLCARPCIVFQ